MNDNENASIGNDSRRSPLRFTAFVFGAVLTIVSIAYAWDHLHVDLLKLEGLIGAQTAAAPADEIIGVTEMITELSLQSIAFASLAFLGGLALMLAALLAGGKPGAVPEHTVARESKEDTKGEETAVGAGGDDVSSLSTQSV